MDLLDSPATQFLSLCAQETAQVSEFPSNVHGSGALGGGALGGGGSGAGPTTAVFAVIKSQENPHGCQQNKDKHTGLTETEDTTHCLCRGEDRHKITASLVYLVSSTQARATQQDLGS